LPGFTGVIFEFFLVFFIERFFAFPNGCVIDISVGAILRYVKFTRGFKGFFVEDTFIFSGCEESLCHKLVKFMEVFIPINRFDGEVFVKGWFKDIPEVSEGNISVSFSKCGCPVE
jgi:hypothetical protein